MVIVNYQIFLRQKIQEEVAICQDQLIKNSLSSKTFEELVIKLYQYCEELNIIKRKIQKLKFYTDRSVVVMPKLIDSEITRIDTKAKQISTAYSLFLFKQKKFKVLSNEGKFFESLLVTITKLSVQKCFSKEDAQYLTKEVNRLFRTNTFNSKYCWKSFVQNSQTVSKSKDKKNSLTQTSFRMFRRTVYSQNSQIKPYVNNKTCFKSLKSRSPVISLWHPNSEYLTFGLTKKDKNKNKVEL